MNEITDEKVAELKLKHGDDIHAIRTPQGSIVVKAPDEVVFERYMATRGKPDMARAATRQLLADCLVHPSPDEFRAIIARRPGLVMTFGGEMLELAGYTDQVRTEKL